MAKSKKTVKKSPQAKPALRKSSDKSAKKSLGKKSVKPAPPKTETAKRPESALNWFEIPVSNFARAAGFYNTVLGVKITEIQMGPLTMGMLPVGPNGVGGAIVMGEGYEPSSSGSLVYLNGSPDLAKALARVEGAGGIVIQPKMKIGDGTFGCLAVFTDTEGNRVALHSMK